MTEIVVPEVLEGEDGEEAYAQGHVAPSMMVLATVANRMSLCGITDACSNGEWVEGFLLGGPANYRADDEHERRTGADQFAHLTKLLESVQHIYWIEDPENDERMIRVDKDHPGAQPWTIVELPW